MLWSPKWYHYVPLELLYLFASSVYVFHLYLLRNVENDYITYILSYCAIKESFETHLQISFLKRMLWSPKWYHYVPLELLYLFASSVYVFHLYLLRNVENDYITYILSYCAIKESFETFFTFANIFLKKNATVS